MKFVQDVNYLCTPRLANRTRKYTIFDPEVIQIELFINRRQDTF